MESIEDLIGEAWPSFSSDKDSDDQNDTKKAVDIIDCCKTCFLHARESALKKKLCMVNVRVSWVIMNLHV